MIKSKIKIRSKYVPEGIKILYEDRDIIIIDKSSGLLSVKARYEKEKTAHQLLINYVRKGNPKARNNLFVVHRLDRETSGVMVFIKSYEFREKFAAQWKDVKKNQIRVHLSERGHPILGDLKYNKNPQGRLALHALSIKIKHPFNKEEMVFETKIPDYFSSCFEVQGKDGNLPRKTKPFKSPKRAPKKEKKKRGKK